MAPIKAQIRNGRLVVDEATDLAEGTEVELVLGDWWDGLTEDDHRRLEKSIEQSNRDMQKGRVIPADVVLDRLRRQA